MFIRRVFDYPKERLPNAWLAKVEGLYQDLDGSAGHTYLSMGYPSWNLLYYSLFCTLPSEGAAYVVETGTNLGWSTVILAQALRDRGLSSKVDTIELDREMTEKAVLNVYRAGLADQVNFHVGDSLTFLKLYCESVPRIDFAFLDGNHECDHVVKEFELIFPKMSRPHGSVFFDNTAEGGVKDALAIIAERFGGNQIEFPNCSWGPAGNVLWQASRV